ncbi:hypothetical protein HanPI659440_Chr09g0347611 [Helianthus annuus]|nr:hypothetical protein HanPI659440_Chr09g0347611 [Helianthus annuus]
MIVCQLLTSRTIPCALWNFGKSGIQTVHVILCITPFSVTQQHLIVVLVNAAYFADSCFQGHCRDFDRS